MMDLLVVDDLEALLKGAWFIVGGEGGGTGYVVRVV